MNILFHSPWKNMSKTTKVSNNYFDESIEMSDTDETGSHAHKKVVAGSNLKGDSPPSAKLSLSDDDYELEDDDHIAGIGYDGHHQKLHGDETNHSKSKNPSPTGVNPNNESGKFMASSSRHSSLRSNQLIDDSNHSDLAPSPNGDSGLKNEIKQLLDCIGRFTPAEHDLEHALKPFIPELIPSIGDIDAFIKIQRIDQKPDNLGLSILDEPATIQSDPSVLDLHLRALSKSNALQKQVIRSLDASTLRKDAKPIEGWINNMKELHGKKPQPSVQYTRRMPDIEELMQVWPQELENAFQNISLPSAEIDLSIKDYSKIIALLLDIPISAASEKAEQLRANNSTVEALHVVFTLYSEFKNSAHFQQMESQR